MGKLPWWGWTVLCLLFLAACEEGTVCHTYRPISDAGWSKHDTLRYELPHAMVPPGTYHLEVGVRNLPVYPYKDIWLVVMQNGKDSLVFEADTLHLSLTDSLGHWENANRTGILYPHVSACRAPLIISQQASKHEIRIVHIMRDNPLRGVADVGIRLSQK